MLKEFVKDVKIRSQTGSYVKRWKSARADFARFLADLGPDFCEINESNCFFGKEMQECFISWVFLDRKNDPNRKSIQPNSARQVCVHLKSFFKACDPARYEIHSNTEFTAQLAFVHTLDYDKIITEAQAKVEEIKNFRLFIHSWQELHPLIPPNPTGIVLKFNASIAMKIFAGLHLGGIRMSNQCVPCPLNSPKLYEEFIGGPTRGTKRCSYLSCFSEKWERYYTDFGNNNINYFDPTARILEKRSGARLCSAKPVLIRSIFLEEMDKPFRAGMFIWSARILELCKLPFLTNFSAFRHMVGESIMPRLRWVNDTLEVTPFTYKALTATKFEMMDYIYEKTNVEIGHFTCYKGKHAGLIKRAYDANLGGAQQTARHKSGRSTRNYVDLAPNEDLLESALKVMQNHPGTAAAKSAGKNHSKRNHHIRIASAILFNVIKPHHCAFFALQLFSILFV